MGVQFTWRFDFWTTEHSQRFDKSLPQNMKVGTWVDLYLHTSVKVFTLADHHCGLSCRWPVSANLPCAEICSTLLYYISLSSWYGNLCNQYRDPINNDKDCRVDQCAMCRDLQHIAVLYFLVNWVWKSMQSIQRLNQQWQRLSYRPMCHVQRFAAHCCTIFPC